MNTEHKNTLKNIGITALLGVLALMATLGSGVIVFSPDSVFPRSDESAEEARALLKARDVISFSDQETGSVVYAYRGEALPDKLAPDEIIERRNETSYTRNLGTNTQGQPEFNTIIYPQPAFFETEEGEWYYVEYAVAPYDVFKDEYLKDNPLSWVTGKTAHAVDFFAGSGDGYIVHTASTWDSVHDATAGTTADATAVDAYAASNSIDFKGVTYDIYRGFLPFVTSSIPATAIVTAASISIYVNLTQNTDNDGADYLTVVQTSQGTHTTLATGDFDQCGSINSPTEGIDSGQRKDISSISTSAYLTFTLNATGMSWINGNGVDAPCSATNGISCFGIREGHDTTDASVVSNTGNLVRYYASEQTGTSQDPYLSVTYYDFTPWQFFEF